ncbi:MAG: hypothetical protein Q8L49_17135 [Burkholderiaceae bacterium]|nr:hypothetical protein [Burkholderiaceae bacterium]
MLRRHCRVQTVQHLKLFDDDHINGANTTRASAVDKTQLSEHAKAKDDSKTADDGCPLHSFTSLLRALGTLAYTVTHPQINPDI